MVIFLKKSIKNKSLYEELKKLTINACTYLNSFYPRNEILRISEDKDYLVNWLYVQTRKTDEIIKKLHLEDVIKIMNKDDNIKRLFGKRIDVIKTVVVIEDVNSLLLYFIFQYFIYKERFEKTTFDYWYNDFEDFFYSKTLKLKDSCLILGFDYDGDKIVIDDEEKIIIRRLSQEEINNYNLVDHPYMKKILLNEIKFVIERFYKEEKNVIDPNKPIQIPTDIWERLEQTSKLFNKVIEAFWIFGSNKIRRVNSIDIQILTFFPFKRHLSSPVWINEINLPPDFFAKEDIKAIKKLINLRKKNEITIKEFDSLTKNQKKNYSDKDIIKTYKRIETAVTRLSYGLKRHRIEDKLIDYMIGFEALYQPDGIQEMTF